MDVAITWEAFGTAMAGTMTVHHFRCVVSRASELIVQFDSLRLASNIAFA